MVGLGPGPAEWVTEAGRAALHAPAASVIARTDAHPGFMTVMAGRAFESLDGLYRTAASFDALVAAMVERIRAATADDEHGVVLAVPGDGSLGEALTARLRAEGLELTVVPGVPLASGALALAGIDAAIGCQALDAEALLAATGLNLVEPSPRWPLAVTGVYSTAVAGDLKLLLGKVYPAQYPCTVVRHAGLPEASTTVLPLARLDREGVSFDHLTHVVLGPVATELPTGSAAGLRAVVARLRAPEIGCPWDLAQTHASLVPYAIEEAYEVVDAIQEGTSTDLLEELGDLLLQVMLHAEMADQEGDFDLNDVLRGISEKLIRRHPHVFGDVEVGGASDVVRNWDQLKAREKGADAPKSAMDGVLKSQPALRTAGEQARRAVKAGFQWSDREGALDKVREELAELLAAETLADRREELGDLLWMLAYLGQHDGAEPEEALRASARKFDARFRDMERRAAQRGWTSLKDHTPSELQGLWQEAKQALRT